MGQVLCSLSHITTHVSWNQCLQGRYTTSSPFFSSSMQMVHSAMPSGPSISSSTALRCNLPMASSEAGGAAFDCGFVSIMLEMIRSRASCV